MSGSRESGEKAVLLGKLNLWSERLARIEIELGRCAQELIDAGVAPVRPVALRRSDRPGVVRIKERILAAEREKTSIKAEMESLDIEVLDESTMELVIPVDFGVRGFLSWMPGERRLAFWREKKDLSYARLRLSSEDGVDIGRELSH